MGITAQSLAISLLSHPALFFNAEDVTFMRNKIDKANEEELRELVRFLTAVIEERNNAVASVPPKS
jgi:hypothetical protein